MKGIIHFFKTRPTWVKCVEFAVFLWVVLNIEHQAINAYYDDREAQRVDQAVHETRTASVSNARSILSRNPEDQSAREFILRK